jgi:Mn2+/Fe2+ NRAMP family transporter
LGTSAIFFGVVLEDFIVSNTSRTLTILFLLGVTARPFLVFSTSTFAEGLKISDVFVPSALGSSIFLAFGVAVSSSVLCAGIGSLASVKRGSVSKDFHLFPLRRRLAWSN